jgi:hypothetical protein
MARFGLVVLLAAWAAGPWTGCDRAPVTPPAAPPPERAPAEQAPSAVPPDEAGVQFVTPARRLG